MSKPVKRILCLWCAVMVSAMGNPGEPVDVAIRFLEKAREKQLDLAPGGDTAISAQTSATKRGQISRRLERMAQELGAGPFNVVDVKTDGELAAVLVSQEEGYDPSAQRVFAVALLNQAGVWRPAPVSASFENTGLAYADAIRKRAEALEDWMLKGKVFALSNLREAASAKLRREMETSISIDSLRYLDALQTGERFIAACRQRSLPEILGLLGGISATQPEDWPLRVKMATSAVRSSVPLAPWALLLHGDVLRVPVRQEQSESQAFVSIACLDPSAGDTGASGPRVEIVHLSLEKTTEGWWQVNLPSAFFQPPSADEDMQDETENHDLLDAFPSKVAELHPPKPLPGARQCLDALLESLENDNFHSLIRLIQPTEDSGAPYIIAARAWWNSRKPGSVRRPVMLAFKENTGSAFAACQWFSARSPNRLDLRILHFNKAADGWLWSPEPTAEADAQAREWAEQNGGWLETWKGHMLAECAVLESLPESGAPSKRESQSLVESWLKHTALGDIAAALRLAARLNTPDSATHALRNLGNDMSGASQEPPPAEISGIEQRGIWTAVGVKFTAGETPKGAPDSPLFPVVNTPHGPRILIEADLFATQSRSRDFLNRTTLDRLKLLPPEAVADLKKLLHQHQANSSAR